MKVYWKSTLIAALFIVCMLKSQVAYADGECDPVKELKSSFEKGVAAEKAGKLVEAFGYYGNARYESSCEGKNPVAGDAEKGWKRVGQRLGTDAERRGHFYTGIDAYGKKDPVAADYYEKIHSYTDTDRVMMKFAKSKSEDMEAFKIVLGHFEARKKSNESLKKEYNYTLDPSYFKELESIASRNGDKSLEREEKAFNRKEYKAGELPPVAESMNHLKLSRKWFSFFNEVKDKKAIERGEKRGDAFFIDDAEPKSLEEAIGYYEIINNAEKIKKAKEKANRLGDAAFKNNDLVRAAAYYEIAGNKARAREAEALQKDKGKKQVDEMLRDDERKKKFKKEQKDLEKELGI